MIEVTNGTYIEFDYVNWKSEKATRKVKVFSIWFGSTEYHKQEQWLIKGFDYGKKDTRTFAMRDMSNVNIW
jgi:predicted DNA-binding transcriptional regulator YafY